MCMSCMEQPCMHVTGLSLSVKQFHRASLPYHHSVHHTLCVGRNVLICWVRSAIVFAQHIWGDEQASAVALSLQAVLLWQFESASLCHESFSMHWKRSRAKALPNAHPAVRVHSEWAGGLSTLPCSAPMRSQQQVQCDTNFKLRYCKSQDSVPSCNNSRTARH
jgi:tRNA(Leu) C34 or U34 (ribose-2'-O)-methylase TrmL